LCEDVGKSDIVHSTDNIKKVNESEW